MFKSKKLIISFLFILAACGIAFAVLYKTSDAVIAKVNNAVITKKQFEAAKASQNLVYDVQMQDVISGKAVPPDKKNSKELLNSMIDNEILYQQAKKENCAVSYSTAKKFCEYSRKLIHDKNLDKTVYKNFKKYIAGIGYSENKYWRKIIPECQKTLSINKLKNKIKSQMSKEDKKNAAKVQSVFQKYTNKIKQDYKVLIYKNKL